MKIRHYCPQKECEKSFACKRDLNKHINQVHFDVEGRKSKCQEPGCDNEFNRTEFLEDHMRSSHGLAKLECRDCGSKFNCQSSLREHQSEVHGQEPEGGV